jgi:hypothetical protein
VNHLRWVPHNLTDTQKVQGLALPKKVLPKLRSLKHQDWRFSIILYEPGFCLATDYEQIWLRPDQEPPERPKHTIQDKKIKGTIAWNPSGFHMIDAFPKGTISDAQYYLDNMLTALAPLQPDAGGRKLRIYSDNARAETAQKSIASCTSTRYTMSARTHSVAQFH